MGAMVTKQAGHVDSAYTADSITALEGLEHIRLRPAMYIGSTGIAGLHHLLWEVVDNSVDEHLAGHGNRIEIELLDNAGFRVRDYGRGMPVDPMTSGVHQGKSAAEVILTVVNAGGKFDGEAYKTSGGLHGVGLKANTALSTRVELIVRRDGKKYAQNFSLKRSPKGDRPGVPDGPVEVIGRSTSAEQGTVLTSWSDLSCFTDDNGQPLAGFSRRMISERLENRCYVHPGLTFVLTDSRTGREPFTAEYHSENGLADLVTKLSSSRDPVCAPIRIVGGHDAEKMQIDVALTWAGYSETLIGYSNGVYNPGGGKHIEGMTKAITRAVNRYARDRNVLKEKEDNPTGADVRQGLIAVVAVLLTNPSYDSQSKNKLETVQAAGAVESVVYEQLSKWLEEHPSDAKRIAEKAASAMRDRLKSDEDRAADRALARKSPLRGSGLPDKLYDCQYTPKEAEPFGGSELFIVEGDSAGGSAVAARNPKTQAILPLRGKVLNVEEVSPAKIAKNAALATLIQSLGCGRGADFSLDKLRYTRVITLADADQDGGHIEALLITFFWRQMRELIEAGRLFVAQPPLYSTSDRDGKVYFRNDAAKDAYMAAHPNHKAHVGRMKGLGEQDWQELRDTTMSPASRTLLQITVDDAIAFDDLVSRLMGNSAQARLDWLLESSLENTNLGGN